MGSCQLDRMSGMEKISPGEYNRGMNDTRSLLARGLATLNLDVGDEKINTLLRYIGQIETWNPAFGLVNASGDGSPHQAHPRQPGSLVSAERPSRRMRPLAGHHRRRTQGNAERYRHGRRPSRHTALHHPGRQEAAAHREDEQADFLPGEPEGSPQARQR